MDEVRKAAQRVVDGAEYPREMHRGYGTERLSLVPTDYLDALRAALARTQEATGGGWCGLCASDSCAHLDRIAPAPRSPEQGAATGERIWMTAEGLNLTLRECRARALEEAAKVVEARAGYGDINADRWCKYTAMDLRALAQEDAHSTPPTPEPSP